MPATTVSPTLKWDVLVTNRQGLVRDLPPGKEQWTWVPTSATLIIGSVHGGYAATLLDSACGCAAHSRLTASQAFTTLELKVGVYKTLKKDGYTITVVQNPTISLADDVAVTKRAIAGQSGPVILVGHSYGGVVITEAYNDPKVAGLVYVTAFAPVNGESAASLIKDAPQGAPVPPILSPPDTYSSIRPSPRPP